MSKKTVVILLVFFTLISAGLHVYKNNQVPVCLNADEAAFGYNAYSILKTGKDEYGVSLPWRLKSFGDYKMPLYSYLSIPFIGLFDLSEFSVRLLASIIGIMFPVLIFFLSRELFQNRRSALLAAFLTSVSPWIHTIARQAHEVTLASFFISLSLIFFLRYLKRRLLKDVILFSLFIGLSLFSYHISRVFAVFLFVYLLFLLARQKTWPAKKEILAAVGIFLIPLAIFSYSEMRFPASRVANLIFYRNSGFTLKLTELNREHFFRLAHNQLILGTNQLTAEYLKYFSPQFLTIDGDANPRFGYSGLSLVTIVEYFFFFIGFYYLFRNKEKYRHFLILLLFVAPLLAALTWQEYSLTRSFYLIVPFILVIAFGLVSSFEIWFARQKKLIGAVVILFLFLLGLSWDFYFFHYPRRTTVIREFQCGYKELVSQIKNNYNRFSEFKITTRHGQPYIFLLFYLRYPPGQYQRQAKLSPPDEYGFGQIERFDKFNFNFAIDKPAKDIFYAGYPESFIDNQFIDVTKIHKIKIGGEDIFWIYED